MGLSVSVCCDSFASATPAGRFISAHSSMQCVWKMLKLVKPASTFGRRLYISSKRSLTSVPSAPLPSLVCAVGLRHLRYSCKWPQALNPRNQPIPPPPAPQQQQAAGAGGAAAAAGGGGGGGAGNAAAAAAAGGAGGVVAALLGGGLAGAQAAAAGINEADGRRRLCLDECLFRVLTRRLKQLEAFEFIGPIAPARRAPFAGTTTTAAGGGSGSGGQAGTSNSSGSGTRISALGGSGSASSSFASFPITTPGVLKSLQQLPGLRRLVLGNVEGGGAIAQEARLDLAWLPPGLTHLQLHSVTLYAARLIVDQLKAAQALCGPGSSGFDYSRWYKGKAPAVGPSALEGAGASRSSALGGLGALPELQELVLGGCRGVGAAVRYCLRGCTGLTRLELSAAGASSGADSWDTALPLSLKHIAMAWPRLVEVVLISSRYEDSRVGGGGPRARAAAAAAPDANAAGAAGDATAIAGGSSSSAGTGGSSSSGSGGSQSQFPGGSGSSSGGAMTQIEAEEVELWGPPSWGSGMSWRDPQGLTELATRLPNLRHLYLSLSGCSSEDNAVAAARASTSLSGVTTGTSSTAATATRSVFSPPLLHQGTLSALLCFRSSPRLRSLVVELPPQTANKALLQALRQMTSLQQLRLLDVSANLRMQDRLPLRGARRWLPPPPAGAPAVVPQQQQQVGLGGGGAAAGGGGGGLLGGWAGWAPGVGGAAGGAGGAQGGAFPAPQLQQAAAGAGAAGGAGGGGGAGLGQQIGGGAAAAGGGGGGVGGQQQQVQQVQQGAGGGWQQLLFGPGPVQNMLAGGLQMPPHLPPPMPAPILGPHAAQPGVAAAGGGGGGGGDGGGGVQPGVAAPAAGLGALAGPEQGQQAAAAAAAGGGEAVAAAAAADGGGGGGGVAGGEGAVTGAEDDWLEGAAGLAGAAAARDQVLLDHDSDEEGAAGGQADVATRPARWEKRRDAIERELRTSLAACSVFVRMTFP